MKKREEPCEEIEKDILTQLVLQPTFDTVDDRRNVDRNIVQLKSISDTKKYVVDLYELMIIN